MLNLDRIRQAEQVLQGTIRKTELIPTTKIAPACELFLKSENLQITGSFKLRGAYYKMSLLSADDRKKEIIACSAGNHAQGVAYAAREMGLKARIFIPGVAPIFKIETTKSYGAEIEIIDGIYDDAYAAAIRYQQATGGIFIHPFDDVDIIAGQGTIGLEIMAQAKDLSAVVVPVGGGGLISGIGCAVKTLNPNCKVYGVHADGAVSMRDSLRRGKRQSTNSVSTFADGIAVKTPGVQTYAFCEQYVDDIFTVSDDETATAILALMEQQKLVSEGAGAVAVAAVMFGKLPAASIVGKKVCAIVSGGNIDVNILSRVLNRGLVKTGRLSELTIEMLDKPGELKEIATIIADLGANITKVRHNFGGENTDINDCFLHISMETKNREHLLMIKATIEDAGYNVFES